MEAERRVNEAWLVRKLIARGKNLKSLGMNLYDIHYIVSRTH